MFGKFNALFFFTYVIGQRSFVAMDDSEHMQVDMVWHALCELLCNLLCLSNLLHAHLMLIVLAIHSEHPFWECRSMKENRRFALYIWKYSFYLFLKAQSF